MLARPLDRDQDRKRQSMNLTPIVCCLGSTADNGIGCCSTGFIWGSTIELPLKAPTGSVIASDSVRKRMPMVGRLLTMVKPMPAAWSRAAR
jgi:hypothetical protein